MERKIKQLKRLRRHRKVRAKIRGSLNRPRLCVFRSNRHIYALLVNDEKGNTILSASDFEFQKPKGSKGKTGQESLKQESFKKEGKDALKGKMALAFATGELIAQKALKKKIKKALFDRGGYKYHGRVKALAQGAKTKGLLF